MNDIIQRKILTPEEESSRDSYLFDYHADHSKRTGDWHFNQANMISGSADYTPADEGGDPPGYQSQH